MASVGVCEPLRLTVGSCTLGSVPDSAGPTRAQRHNRNVVFTHSKSNLFWFAYSPPQNHSGSSHDLSLL